MDARRTAWLDAAAGGIGGLVAAVPMTAFWAVAAGRLPKEEWRALPPRQIVRRLSRKTEAERFLDRDQEVALTWASHFGYAAATGALWGLLARRAPLDSVPGGVAFGLGIWAVSYLGWLPVAGLMPPVTRQSSGRNALMIAAHVIFGGTLAAVGGIVRRELERRRPDDRESSLTQGRPAT
jgi:uncharacterized membrane protein YagU involved in acid resistance